MDEITVGPLQLCNITDAQPGGLVAQPDGLGIKVKNEITVPYKSIRYDEIIMLGIREFVCKGCPVAH
jgi:hypothetical protein